MSDRKKFTVQSFPKTWEGRPTFREVFLVHLPPHLAESCQKLGEYALTVLFEANMSDAEPDDLVRALAADLYFSCLFLNALQDYEGLDLEEHLPGWRDRVCEVADEMRKLTEQDVH